MAKKQWINCIRGVENMLCNIKDSKARARDSFFAILTKLYV